MSLIVLYYVSIIFFCAYVAGNIIKYGIPESLSETAYLNKKYGFIFFSAFCICTTLPLMIFWLTISVGQTFQFLVFLAALGLIMVGLAGKYKNGLDRKIHISSSFLAGICSVIWTMLYTPIWPISLLLGVLLVSIGYKVKGIRTEGTTDNSIIFFGEMAAFLNMFISTYIYWLLI